MRSQTDEMLAARWDPEPFVDRDGNHTRFVSERREGEDDFVSNVLAPRPEYIPSRYITEIDILRMDIGDNPHPDDYVMEREDLAEYEAWKRPPVNPILVEYREDSYPELHRYPAVWLADLIEQRGPRAFTPEQVDHARKVLTRLAALA
jgi:hypothetical protein